MNTTLAVIGLVFVGAAVVGGGLKAVGFEVPLLASRGRQLLLAVVGAVAFVVALVAPQLNSGNQGSSKASPPPQGSGSVPRVPSASPGTPPPPQLVLAQVRIDTPAEGTTIKAGQDVQLSGSVKGLGVDALWIISKPDTGAGLYFLPARGPVADHDGNWQFLDQESGDPSNHNIVFKAVQADGRCSEALARVGPDVDGSYTFQTLPETCKIRAERTIAAK